MVQEDELKTADGAERNGSAYLFLHIFLGPLMGLLAIIAFSLVTMPPKLAGPLQFNASAWGEMPFVFLGIVMVNWLVGFVPAWLHAASMLILHRLLGRGIAWVLLTPVMGWLAAFLPLVLIAGSDPRTFTDGPKMALVGSAAAIGCQLIAWRRRIYPF